MYVHQLSSLEGVMVGDGFPDVFQLKDDGYTQLLVADETIEFLDEI